MHACVERQGQDKAVADQETIFAGTALSEQQFWKTNFPGSFDCFFRESNNITSEKFPWNTTLERDSSLPTPPEFGG